MISSELIPVSVAWLVTRSVFTPLPPDGMLVHCWVTPSIKFTGTHLHIWVERGTARVKLLAQEHNTMSPTKARTWTALSGVDLERTNHVATASHKLRKIAS